MKDVIQSSPPTLLFVSDTLESLDVLNYLDDFNVNIAMNGQNALTIAELTHPDLIVIDISIPRTDGFVTCLRFKEHEDFSRIPVLFLSALTDTDYRHMAFKAGAVDYMSKPIQEDEFIARISTHLTLKKQREQIKEQARKLDNTSRMDHHSRLLSRRLNDQWLKDYARTICSGRVCSSS